MKNISSLLLLFSVMYSTFTYAESNQFPLYIGMKTGIVNVGSSMNDEPINAAIYVGIQSDIPFALEWEINRTLSGGKVDNSDWDVSSFAWYGIYRSRTPVFVKAKIGKSIVDYVSDISEFDPETTMGLGFGYWLDGGLIEIEFTNIGNNNGNDVDFISLGIAYYY